MWIIKWPVFIVSSESKKLPLLIEYCLCQKSSEKITGIEIYKKLTTPRNSKQTMLGQLKGKETSPAKLFR
jgi:hypothetical protein